MSGKLYVVGTPIGNLEDFSPRAVRILSEADFIAAEDTRVTLKLLNRFEIKKELVSYYEHNKNDKGQWILDRIAKGEVCALVSDAGMPAISDPGEELVRAAHENGIAVESVPGPSALITALSISGMPSGRFCFEGFLSVNKVSRKAHLEEVAREKRPMILYEAPHRIKETLEMLNDIMPNRHIVLARELTKKYEEYLRGTPIEILDVVNELKGEMVIIISGCSDEEKNENLLNLTIKEHYKYYLESGYDQKEALKKVAKDRNTSKSNIYQEVLGKNK